MNNTLGRSVRLFLVDGNSNGLITAEIINWSGHILSGSRLEKDSLASAKWIQKNDSNAGYAKLHKKLIHEGTLSDDNNTGIAKFNDDVAFSSPSAASAIIYGRADNGRTSWKVKGSTTTYADWQEQKVREIIGEGFDV